MAVNQVHSACPMCIEVILKYYVLFSDKIILNKKLKINAVCKYFNSACKESKSVASNPKVDDFLPC